MKHTPERGAPPGLTLERAAWSAGADVVVGVDEVGRGAWAGPLTVAAVVLPRDRRVNGVRDSKMLTESRREQLFDRLTAWCLAWAVGHCGPDECDALGMSEAQRLAASRAIAGLGLAASVVLVDGPWDFIGRGRPGAPEVQTVIRGDRVSLSIATASIIAKVTRDRIMRRDAECFPGYDFDRNKGYPCPRHVVALQGYGPTSIHRRSWVFMDRLAWRGCRRTVRAATAPAQQATLFT